MTDENINRKQNSRLLHSWTGGGKGGNRGVALAHPTEHLSPVSLNELYVTFGHPGLLSSQTKPFTPAITLSGERVFACFMQQATCKLQYVDGSS